MLCYIKVNQYMFLHILCLDTFWRTKNFNHNISIYISRLILIGAVRRVRAELRRGAAILSPLLELQRRRDRLLSGRLARTPSNLDGGRRAGQGCSWLTTPSRRRLARLPAVCGVGLYARRSRRRLSLLGIQRRRLHPQPRRAAPSR